MAQGYRNYPARTPQEKRSMGDERGGSIVPGVGGGVEKWGIFDWLHNFMLSSMGSECLRECG